MKSLTIASVVFMAASTPLVGSLETQPDVSAASHTGIRVDPGRPQWPIARESSGRWGVVGEAVARHTGPQAVQIRAVTFTVMDRRGHVLSEEAFDMPGALEEIVVIFHCNASGEIARKPAGTAVLDPGDIGVAFLAALIEPRAVPDRAVVTMHFSRGPARTFAVPLEVFDPGQRMGWPLSLANEPWIAFNTAGSAFHWIGGAIPADDALFISQRFAIDLVQIDPDGQTHPASASGKEDYYAWGEEILSAGRGHVVAVLRDQRDIEIGEAPSAAQNPAGNHVVVRHGPRLFSLYAHMQQESARVSVGDWVGRGDVLGLVGNSGNTTQPHLHVHFTDAWPASSNPVESLSFSQGVPALFWGVHVLRDGTVFKLNGSTPLEPDIIFNGATRRAAASSLDGGIRGVR